MTPRDVALDMARRIEPSGGRETVVDPGAGEGSLLLAAAETILSRAPGTELDLFGVELDPKLAAVASAALSSVEATRTEIVVDDFLATHQDAVSRAAHALESASVVIANPPYGGGREYDFFASCNQRCPPGTQLIFLLPLEFVDRVEGLSDVTPLTGRPLGVTTGHAIVRHLAGTPVTVRPIRETIRQGRFSVLTGVKLYELGGGSPKQTPDVIRSKPFSSTHPRLGWLPCVRTGDVQRDSVQLGRLWVEYGDHLAHPKDIARFSGPKVFVRRVPIWSERAIGAGYNDDTVLCAGDVLVVREPSDDADLLRGLSRWLNTRSAASLMHIRRPMLTRRDSFPKFSVKDLAAVLANAPPDDALHQLSNRPIAA
jgi:hypothetical protein